jgi:hypothetical protein
MIGILLISSLPFMAMQQNHLDVSVLLVPNTQLGWSNVPMNDLSKSSRLAVTPSSLQEKYVPVISALYEDHLDDNECVCLQKDLRNDVPYAIATDLSAQDNGNKYLFPGYISQSFIEQINQGNNKHVIYKNGDKIVTARYELEWLQDRKMAERIVLPVQKIDKPLPDYTLPSLFSNGDSLMNLAALCGFLLFLAV